MKCLYYLAPTLDCTHRVCVELHAAGIKDSHLHVISRDERGLDERHIPSSNYLETLDLLRTGLIGSALGCAAGVLGVALLKYFEPFGPNAPNIVYYATLLAATLFGAWEGGLAGIATENSKLAEFHHDIEAGRYLILTYVPREEEALLRRVMRERHPQARLAGIDRHFINPFRAVKRRAHCAHPQGGFLPQE